MARLEKRDDGTWQVISPAKLNLGLRVFPVRADGFHDLETWMVPLSWHDVLTVGALDKPLALEVTGRTAGVPVEVEKNLVGRAALTMAKTAGVEARGVITLHKVLPPGGGIGGGSGNAASTLLALNRAWGLEWPEEKLCAIAGTLGSDIPFFVRAEPTFCTGRGEIMQPLPMAQRLFAVLILPPMGCATKDVYAAFDAGKRYEPRKPATDWQQVARSSAAELLETLVNDLEPGAFFVAPWLRELRERAAGIAGRPVLMTGSGSTLYTLCDSGAEASELAERIGAGLPEGCACIAARVG